MKKVPIRIRLMIITSVVLIICCLTVYFCVLNSAIMKLDSIEDGVLNIADEETGLMMDIYLTDLFPEISDVISEAKADFVKQSIIITLLVVVFGSLATFFTSKLALKPLKTLSNQVSGTTISNLSEPLPLPEARDEIRNLSEIINHMRYRLHKAFVAEKQFSANAAHELRTPLSVMQTSLEVFNKKESKTPEEYKEKLDATLVQVDRLNNLVNALLSFQSISSASLEDSFNVYELADEVYCDLIPLAEERNITLSLDGRSDCEIRGNTTLLYQSIYNLTENAIKYNKVNGAVTVTVSDNKDGVLVTVTDTGAGIPREHWDKIFEAFYRVDKSRSRQSGGTGLGLAMVKETALLHSGRVWVDESSDAGTRICMLINSPC